MHVIASFEYSTELELAITRIEQLGLSRDRILAAPLEQKIKERRVFDSINRADGVGTFDGAMALGTAFMVLGTIYGFVLRWGPIVWGLIGLFIGFALGFLLDYLIEEHTGRRRKRGGMAGFPTEVVLIVNCSEQQAPEVEKILWEHLALGVAKVKT